MRRALLILLASSTAHAAPCESEKLAAATHAAWGVDNLTTLDCRPIHAARPLLLVQAALDENGKAVPLASGLTRYAAVLDPATDEVWWHREGYAGTPGNQSTFALADLDRDGRDELIEHMTHEGHEGTGSEHLFVYRVGDGEVREAGSLELGMFGLARMAEQNGCRGTWAIVGGPGNVPRVQVVGVREHDKRLAAPPETCPLDGTHRYRWTGTGFALAD